MVITPHLLRTYYIILQPPAQLELGRETSKTCDQLTIGVLVITCKPAKQLKMTGDLDEKTLTAQCYCKVVHFTIKVKRSDLPLATHLCHCSICRYTHGSFCVFHAPLPEGVAPRWVAPSGTDKVTIYRHAKAQSERMFCNTCGCHIGDIGLNDPGWVISTSIFDTNANDIPKVWEIKTHVNTHSAPGGGIYDWLPTLGGKEIRVWNPADEEKADTEIELPRDSEGKEMLRAECHCGGVSFNISRPTRAMVEDAEYRKILPPGDPTHWSGVLDLCDDCRLLTGSHVVPWTFVPESSITPQFSQNLELGTAKSYQSSPGVLRSFCGTCGATVGGYFGDERMHSNGDRLLDISCGILRAPEGVLAEQWITWRTGRPSWADSGARYDRELAESLIAGMATWGKEKHGEVLDFPIA
jgi:hypothetical protein